MTRGREVALRLRRIAGFEAALARDLTVQFRALGRALRRSYREGGDAIGAVLDRHKLRVADILRRRIAASAIDAFWLFSAGTKHARAWERKDDADAAQRIAMTAALREWIEAHVGRRTEDLDETTREIIAREIARGIEDGASQDDIAARIERATGGEIGASRARSIARTESHGAANFATEEAARATGLTLEREWAATRDMRTRPTHWAVDGQRRAAGEPFLVGGAALQYPGDPAGPPGEIINCRCVLLYHRADGRSILNGVP